MDLLRSLKLFFGFDSFRKGQREIIESILRNENVLAILPTGGGKSLCYQLPALISGGFSIVISPLIALMKDQVDSLNKNEEIAAFINSSLDYHSINQIMNKISNGQLKLIYVAPERLENKTFAETIKNLNPHYIFIDEAHCISEWGHNFRPSYLKIREFCEFIGNGKISAFTATATPDVRDDIINLLHLEQANVFIRGFERENLHLNVIKTTEKNEQVVNLLTRDKLPAIIYASTRKETESLSAYFKTKKINAAYYHAGLDSEMRRLIQDDFINDRTDIIIATNAFGMGIDKSNIRTIIHYNIPQTIENYYQEIGRAGRDGIDSDIYLFYSSKDKNLQEFLIRSSFATFEDLKNMYDLMCNYHQISMGSLPLVNFPLEKNLISLLERNKIGRNAIHTGLKVLENSGYIIISNNYNSRSTFIFTMESEKLKNYVKKLKLFELQELILTLVKTYGGKAFVTRVPIDTKNLSEQLGIIEPDIIEMLTRLHNNGIIDFSEKAMYDSFRLLRERQNSNYLELKTGELADRINHQYDKLNKIVDYATTDKCRSAFILEYFGETDSEKCGRCDNCLGTNHSNDSILRYLKEQVFTTLEELNAPVSWNDFMDTLTGKKHLNAHLESFGCLVNYTVMEIEEAIDLLIDSKKITYRDKNLTLAPGLKRKTEQSEIKTDTNYEASLEIYNLLFQKRKEISKKFNQAPQMICSDDLLRSIASAKPANDFEMMKIPGLTRIKFNKFGADFLEVISELKEKQDSEQNPYKDLQILIDKKYSLKQISEIKKTSIHLLACEVEALLSLKPDLNIQHLVDKNNFNKIKDLYNRGMDDLNEIKRLFGDLIPPAELKVIIAKLKCNK